MPADELERCFDHAEERGAALLQSEMDFLRVRRRRLSLERLPVDEAGLCTRPGCKVVVLGDEGCSGKISMLELLCLDPLGTGDSADIVQTNCDEFLPMDIRELTFRIHAAAPSAPAAVDHELQLWAPICTEQYAALRPLYYSGTDVFLIVFSIAEPRTLEAARGLWQREIEPFQSQHEHPVPVLLVGNFGEERQQPMVPRELVLSDQAVQLAQQCGMTKYLEITSFNPAHIHEMFRQAVLAAHHAGGGGTPVSIRRNREMLAVRSVLRAPAPSGFFDPWERAFRLDLTACESSGVQYLVSWDGNPPTDRSHRYKGKLVLRHPYPKVIQVQSVMRCKYRSEVCCFPVPIETSCPVGHFDTGANRLVLEQGDASEVDLRYFYTLDGSAPCAESQTCGRDWPVVDVASQPKVVRVCALSSGRLVSSIVSFSLPAVLPPPEIRLVPCTDRMTQELHIAVQRGVHVKYTTDGTDPSFSNGKSYPGYPVKVSTAVHPVKAIALPVAVLPSAIAVAMNAP